MKINIAKCLLELLLDRGDVTIPGLGKFEVQKKHASFGEGRKSLIPPSRGFLFTEDHDANDHLFRNYIAEVAGLDEIQANKFVSKFSASVLEGVNAKKPVELAYVGVLRKKEEKGKIEFLQNSMTLAKINNLLPEVSLPDPKAMGDIPKMEVTVPKEGPIKDTSPEKKPSSSQPLEKNKVVTESAVKKPLKKEPLYKESKPQAAPVKREEPKERGCWPWIIGALLLGALMIFGLKMCFKADLDVYQTGDPDGVVVEEGVTNGEDGVTTVTDGTNESGSDQEDKTLEDATLNGKTESGIANGSMPEDCIIIVASMQNQVNISRLKNKVQNKKYELYTEIHGAYTRVGVRIDCTALPSSYEDYIRKVSNDFDVNAWSLSPEFPQ